MDDLIQALLGHYQIRKTRRQKAQFRAWLTGNLEAMGYAVREEKSPLIGSVNVIVGDVEKADYLFTAHYDTCPVLPVPNFLAPKNLAVTMLYQVALAFVIIALGLGAGILLALLLHWPWAVWVGYFAAFALFLMGPANRHTANDNTSGVAVLLRALATLPQASRDRAAFVFFDNEELGLLGSAYFKKRHTRQVASKPLINFDCVSDGDHLLLVLGKGFAKAPQAAEKIGTALQVPAPKTKEQCPAGKAFYPSDQKHFAKGVGVVALRHRRGIGHYLGRIHTFRDTVFDEANIDLLGQFVVRLVTPAQ